MRILITGAGGFLGRGLVQIISGHDAVVRRMDVRPLEGAGDSIVGDVADLATIRRALDGQDALVIAHMAKNPDGYRDPTVAFDVNVKGVANLLFAAAEGGIKRIVLISSTSATAGPHDPPAPHTQAPRVVGGLYALTKCLQEITAEYFAREHGLSIAALRIGYVVDARQLKDKYGRPVGERPALLTDPRDVGEVAWRCLQRDKAGFEVFNVMSTPESLSTWDVASTCERLGWQPAGYFDSLPLPGKSAR